MSEEKLLKNLMSLMSGINACLERNLKGPALTLIYSTIDTAGWLDTDQTFTTRQGFINWTEKYLLTATPLAVNAIDLYAARCGLLHTFTPDSQLSANGKARRLCYAWGTARVQDVQRLIDATNGNQIYAAVHVDELFEALKLGLLTFVDDIENDQPRKARVLAKAKKFFSEWDVESVEALITAIDNS
jgi:hypothetical protein